MAGAQGIKAGRAYVEVGTHDKYVAGLRRAQRRMRAFAAAVTSAGSTMMRVGAMALAPLLLSAKAFASMGDRIAKMAKRTGMSVEALSALEFAASQSGTSIEALEKGVKRMAMTIMDAGRGLSTAVEGLAALGLEYKDLAGLAPEEQFKLIADRLSKVGHASEKAAIAQMVFGKAGTALLPMIEGGAKGIDELIAKAEKYGLVITAEAARGAEEFTDAMDIARRVVKMAAFEVGQALAPALMDATKWVIDATRSATAWIKANREMVVWILKWAATLMAVGAAMFLVGKGIAVIAGLIGMLKAAVVATKALYVAFTLLTAHPVVAVLTAIALLAARGATALFLFSKATVELSNEMENLRKKGDAIRKQDKLRLKRLEQLAKSEQLTAAEMKEASDLIGPLTDRYGDFGLTVDKTSRKLVGMAAALKEVAAVMKAREIAEVRKEIGEIADNLDKVHKEFKKGEETWEQLMREKLWPLIPWLESGDIEERKAQAEALWAAYDQAQEKLVKLTGGGEQPDIATRIRIADLVAKKMEALDRRILRLKLQHIDDEHARRIKEIEQRYTFERKENEKNKRIIAKLNEAEAIEKQNLDIAFNRRAMGELQRALEQAAESDRRRKEAAADADLARSRDIEGLKLRATLKGHDLARALFKLDRKRALEKARELGQNVKKVEEEFDLKRKILEAGKATAQVSIGVAGTFSARALWGMGGGKTAERTAKATEATAKEVKKIRRGQAEGRLVFD